MNENENYKLAEDLSKKINVSLTKHFLVKPLEPVLVKKEFSKPVATDNNPKKDENDVEAVDYDKVETEIKEVESDFCRGIVLKIPFEYEQRMSDEKYPAAPIQLGDVIVFKQRCSEYFDLFKDTKIVHSFDIISVEKEAWN